MVHSMSIGRSQIPPKYYPVDGTAYDVFDGPEELRRIIHRQVTNWTMNTKVIVVGGGPVGLVAAHALHLAGIDFVLLERRASITDNTGASVVLGPPSLRILSQFGLREELEDAGAELGHAKSFTRDGYKFRDSTQIRLLKEWLVMTPRNV